VVGRANVPDAGPRGAADSAHQEFGRKAPILVGTPKNARGLLQDSDGGSPAARFDCQSPRAPLYTGRLDDFNGRGDPPDRPRRLTVNGVMLGTGGFHPNETRHTAGVMLPGCGVLLDAGTSAFRVAERLESPDLQIFLSHPHWDHIIGLTFLLVPMIDGRIERCRLYGDAHTLEAVKTLLFAEATFPILPAFEFCPLDETPEIAIPGGTLRHQALTSHPGGCRAYRLDFPGASLAYVTDTATDGTYREFIRGADLLIHECYFADGRETLAEKTGHSCLSPVARLAADVEVEQLLLTHIDPLFPDASSLDLSVARKIFAETEIAHDGLLFDVGR